MGTKEIDGAVLDRLRLEGPQTMRELNNFFGYAANGDRMLRRVVRRLHHRGLVAPINEPFGRIVWAVQ